MRSTARIYLRSVVKICDFKVTEIIPRKAVWSIATRSVSHDAGQDPLKTNERSARSDQHFQTLVVALQNYKRLNGDYLIPKGFYVPHDNLEWPKETWNLHLGNELKSLHLGLSYREKANELSAIGIEIKFVAPPRSNYSTVEIALLHFKKTHGHMDVPLGLIILEGDNSFPEITWGYKLGRIVRNIRLGKSCVSARERLIEIGFNYNIQQLRR